MLIIHVCYQNVKLQIITNHAYCKEFAVNTTQWLAKSRHIPSFNIVPFFKFIVKNSFNKNFHVFKILTLFKIWIYVESHYIFQFGFGNHVTFKTVNEVRKLANVT